MRTRTAPHLPSLYLANPVASPVLFLHLSTTTHHSLCPDGQLPRLHLAGRPIYTPPLRRRRPSPVQESIHTTLPLPRSYCVTERVAKLRTRHNEPSFLTFSPPRQNRAPLAHHVHSHGRLIPHSAVTPPQACAYTGRCRTLADHASALANPQCSLIDHIPYRPDWLPPRTLFRPFRPTRLDHLHPTRATDAL